MAHRDEFDISDDYMTDVAIAESLSRTWAAFFHAHGRLTEVQRRSMPTILDGNDVLVTSPTASGKTEAACAPLVERMLRTGREWTVLYISPTRALVNDLFRRLCGPVESLGLAIRRRTGDSRARSRRSPASS
jgi:ATP-dependent Lhr-like helicase